MIDKEEKEKLALDKMREAQAEEDKDMDEIRNAMEEMLNEMSGFYIERIKRITRITFQALIEDLKMSEMPDEKYEVLQEEFEKMVLARVKKQIK
ncbi:MAG: hypothetical protein ACOC5G_04085 [Acidobacteriota bacterium]